MRSFHLRRSFCHVGLAALLVFGSIPAAAFSAHERAWAEEAADTAAVLEQADLQGDSSSSLQEAEGELTVSESVPASPDSETAASPAPAAPASVPTPAPAPEPAQPTLPALSPGWNHLANGQWYYGQADGAPQTGWLYDNGAWYYLSPDAQGAMATGWTQAGDAWYYLDGSGAMLTGWQWIGGNWYYLGTSGARAHGWQWIGRAWYYLYPDTGAMAAGWTQINGTWYYLNWSGAMETGWLNQGGTWYYLWGSGAMATGWQWIGNAWYYLYPDTGAMATGWLQLGDSWYYLRSSGAMVTGNYTIGNEYHLFDGAGVWQGSTDLAGLFTSWAQPEWSATDWLILVDTARCKVAVFWGSQWNWQLQYLWDCAPGKASTPTVKGRFTVGNRGYYFDSKNARCFYYTQFYGNYLFHSVLYHQTSSPTWIMDGRVGMPLSHGCVRLDVWNAQWIYNNIPRNTRVYIW